MHKRSLITRFNTLTGVTKVIVTRMQGVSLAGLFLLICAFTGLHQHIGATQTDVVIQKVPPLDNAGAKLKGEHFVLHTGSTGNHLSLLQSFVSVIENEEDDEPESLKKHLLFQASAQHNTYGLYLKSENFQGTLSPLGRYIFPTHLQPYLLFQVFRI